MHMESTRASVWTENTFSLTLVSPSAGSPARTGAMELELINGGDAVSVCDSISGLESPCHAALNS